MSESGSKRTQGKGSSGGGGDPDDGYEDERDSEAAADAQNTLNEIDPQQDEDEDEDTDEEASDSNKDSVDSDAGGVAGVDGVPDDVAGENDQPPGDVPVVEEGSVNEDVVEMVADEITDDVDFDDMEEAEAGAKMAELNYARVVSAEQKEKIRDGLEERFDEEAVDDVYSKVHDFKLQGDMEPMRELLRASEYGDTITDGVDDPSGIDEQQVAVMSTLSEVSKEAFRERYGESGRMHRGQTATPSKRLIAEYLRNDGDVGSLTLKEPGPTSYTESEPIAQWFNDADVSVVTTRDVQAEDVGLAIDDVVGVSGQSNEVEYIDMSRECEVDVGNVGVNFTDPETDSPGSVPLDGLPRTGEKGYTHMRVYKSVMGSMRRTYDSSAGESIGLSREEVAESELCRDVLGNIQSQPEFDDGEGDEVRYDAEIMIEELEDEGLW